MSTVNQAPPASRDPAPAGAGVRERLLGLLRDAAPGFREVHHEPTTTSEASALARGEPLEVGGKAIVMKADDAFHLFVISAARKIDARKIRAHLHARKTRFATAEELRTLTGLVPGSVPPFGHPLLPLPLHADVSVTTLDRIAFNAASLTDSVIMATADWLRLARPDVFDFAEQEPPPEPS
jgi:prolyl-tRNA editing enzyme YbaK/EbsC (Cys-tRNA(Pro) deacylase)